MTSNKTPSAVHTPRPTLGARYVHTRDEALIARVLAIKEWRFQQRVEIRAKGVSRG